MVICLNEFSMSDIRSSNSYRTDDLRDRHWSAWHRGERPLAETLFAGETPPPTGSEMLELINAEVTLRAERGEACLVDEYDQRFPQFAESVLRLLMLHETLEPFDGALSKSVEPPRQCCTRSSHSPRSSDCLRSPKQSGLNPATAM